MTLSPYVFDGGTALVTGAAGGIGVQVARALAARGSHLALADRDAAALEALAAGLRDAHPSLTVTSHVVDLADPAQIERLVDEVRAAHRPLTLLVNNAGVALSGTVEELEVADIDWVMSINFRAPVQLTHLFLPDLVASGGAHIVNVSSLFGLIAPAGQSAYAASKFALRGFSESLRAELAGRVGVTTVHPGGIRTNIARNSRVGARVDPAKAAAGVKDFEKLLTFPADKAAAMIVDAVARRRPRLLIGASAVVPDALARITPTRYDWVIATVRRSARQAARSRAHRTPNRH